MTNLYIADCRPFMNHQTIEALAAQCDPNRQNKILNLMSIEKKAQSLATGLLLNQLFGLDATYTYTDTGKPYLTNREAYISISHTRHWVAIAVSKCEIGLDIQEISDIKPAVMLRCFTTEQQNWIGSNATRFTQLWVQKEAYAKYTGTGLTAPFINIIPDDRTPNCTGIYEDMCYALYGDDTVTIRNTEIITQNQ